jgi:threonine synthase
MLDFVHKFDKRGRGIWKYADFYSERISPENRLFMNDGGNSLAESANINKNLGIDHLFFKREDQNESGSLKGRSLAYQVSLAKERGEKNLVISTSGNAGIALAAYAKKAGIGAFIFISPETESGKIADMQKYDPVIIKTIRPIRLANYVSAKYKISNLRPSIDDSSIEGFKSIAFEIGDEVGEIDAIFTFVTSGSSFVGMHRGFEKYLEEGMIQKIPQMYAVQSGGIHSAIAEGKISKVGGEESLAGRLGIKNTRRQKEILEIISKTNGQGVFVENSEIESAQKILLQNDLMTSWEGCASFAGLMKIQEEKKFKKAVCIFSGKFREAGKGVLSVSGIYTAETFEEVDKIMDQFKKI